MIASIQQVINCCGKMTYLGSSKLSQEVIEAMAHAGSRFFVMEDLNTAVGEFIAEEAGAEAACVSAGASAGIVMSVAAMVTQGQLTKVESVPFVDTLKKEIIIQKGHNVSFGASVGQMICLGGGQVKEIGQANKCLPDHLTEAITENVAAVLYIQSHHAVQEGSLSLDTVIALAHQQGVPVIVDAAAEEDIQLYVAKGADLVIYSGAKAFSGPTTGCIVGKKEYIKWCKAQFNGVARPMKVGKENLLGLMEAIRMRHTASKTIEEQEALLQPIEEILSQYHGIKTTYAKDSMGRSISRLRAHFAADAPLTAFEFSTSLKQQKTAVYVRAHRAIEGQFVEFDARNLSEEEVPLVISVIKEVIEHA